MKTLAPSESLTGFELPVLSCLEQARNGLGSGNIFLKLKSDGIQASPATVGRWLKTLDVRRLTCKVSNRGRVLTPRGMSALKELRWRQEKRDWAEGLLNKTASATAGEYLELLEGLRIVEGEIAKLATEKATPQEILRMRDVVERQHDKIRKLNQGATQGLTFHALLAEASRNRFLRSAADLMWHSSDLLRDLWLDAAAITGTSSYPHHVRIFEAVREGRPDAAAQAMHEHFDIFISSLRRSLPGRTTEAGFPSRLRQKGGSRGRNGVSARSNRAAPAMQSCFGVEHPFAGETDAEPEASERPGESVRRPD
jgi:GntR family transcriptional repressor for pyruvate dehydrogenase complex